MRVDMDLVVIAATIVTTSIGYPLARAIARVIENRAKREPLDAPEVVARLRSIEQAVEAMSVEVERVTEHQRFMTRILSERVGLPASAAPNGLPPAPPRPLGQHNQSGG